MAKPKSKRRQNKSANSKRVGFDTPGLLPNPSEMNDEQAPTGQDDLDRSEPEANELLPPKPQTLAFGISLALLIGWLLFLAYIAYQVML